MLPAKLHVTTAQNILGCSDVQFDIVGYNDVQVSNNVVTLSFKLQVTYATRSTLKPVPTLSR
jgi:hypothetical protein